MKFKTLLTLILLTLVAIFSVQNSEPISVRFLGWHFAWSQALVILVAAFAGVLLGVLIGTFGVRRGGAKPADPAA